MAEQSYADQLIAEIEAIEIDDPSDNDQLRAAYSGERSARLRALKYVRRAEQQITYWKKVCDEANERAQRTAASRIRRVEKERDKAIAERDDALSRLVKEKNKGWKVNEAQAFVEAIVEVMDDYGRPFHKKGS